MVKGYNYAFPDSSFSNNEQNENAGDQLSRLITDKLRSAPNMSFSEALTEVQLENRELANMYAETLRH